MNDDTNDEQTSKDNSTPENIEETREPVPKPKTNILEPLIFFVLVLAVPVITWIGICGVIGVFASDYTSRWAAILIGLLVGSVLMGMVFYGDSPELEKVGCSLMWLVLLYIVLSTIRDFRHRAIQRQRNHTQQERKQNRSQREATPTVLMAQHRSEFL